MSRGGDTADGAPIDWPALEARHAARPAAVARLVGIAIQTLSGVPAELRALANAADLDGLARSAHSLRGSAEAIQAPLVGRLASALEQSCRDGAADAGALARALAGAVDDALVALAQRGADRPDG